MDGILEKQNPVSITKYRDFQNSTPEIPQNEGSNGDFYFDEVEIDFLNLKFLINSYFYA